MDKQKVYKCLKIAQSWVLPPLCLLCGARGEDSGLCAGCLGDLPRLSHACSTCALPITDGDLCGPCANRLPIQDEAIALFHYASPIDMLIRRLKFEGDLACARLLGLLMAAGLGMRGVSLPDCLVPVPLHRRRLAVRGFNQALELARPIAGALEIPLDYTCCRRVRATTEQSGLSADARRVNLHDAFAVSGCPANDVAIIDDVMTTGQTIDALAHALKAAGVARVRVWVCARASDLGRSRPLW